MRVDDEMSAGRVTRRRSRARGDDEPSGDENHVLAELEI